MFGWRLRRLIALVLLGSGRSGGLVFAQTKPKLAVYTHIVQLGSERIPPPTLDDIVAETRETYSGPLASVRI